MGRTFMLLLSCLLACSLAAIQEVRIAKKGDTFYFNPAVVQAAVGDTVRFLWPSADINTAGASFGVVRSNNSAICQALTSADTPFFNCPESASAANVCDVAITSAWTNNSVCTWYNFKGTQSNKASACPSDPGSSLILAGRINVGLSPAYNCGSSAAQVSRDACLAAVTGSGAGAPLGACIWCGFGSEGDSLTNGFCYTPSWSGQNKSCPCDGGCWTDYQCPPSTTRVACKNAGCVAGASCPAYVAAADNCRATGASIVSISIVLVAMLLALFN